MTKTRKAFIAAWIGKGLFTIVFILQLITPDALFSQPSLCTVSGVIYLPDGVTRARNVQIIVRDVRDVNQIPILLGPAYYYTNDTGLVAFTVPRQGTMKLEAPTGCLNVKGGVTLTIPNSATATLQSFAATSCVGASTTTPAGLTIQVNDVSVSSNKFHTLDFSSDFTVTETPDQEANIDITGSIGVSNPLNISADLDTFTVDMSTRLNSLDMRIGGVRKFAADSTGKISTAYGVVNTTASSLVFGSATATSHVFTTDGTGDGEIMLPAQSINTTEITDDAITAAKILADAVGASEIATDAVGTPEISAGAVDASELVSTAVTPGSYGSATQVATFTVDADGRLTAAANVSISGDTTDKEWDIPAGFFNPDAGSLTGATPLADDADATNNFTLDQLEFSASAENYISATYKMPDDWDQSTAPTFKITYYSETGHGSNTVEWDLSARYIRAGTDSWIGAQGTAVTTNHNPTTADIWYETSALAPTPAGSIGAGVTYLELRIFRDGDDGSNDTHTATARIVHVVMTYASIGSIGAGGGGDGAPTDATYITQTANGSLSAEQALGSLSTGMMASTTTTGIVATRTLTGTTGAITVSNGDGLSNPTFTLPAAITVPTSYAIGSDPADAGVIRLENAALIEWEASPAGTDITLSVDASEILQASGAFNAVTLTENTNAVPNSADHLGFFAATTSAQLAGVISNETGSDALVFATAPSVSSVIATGSVGLTLSNGATGPGAMRILEDTDDGSNYTEIKTTAMGANVVYTLPPDDGSSGQVLHTDGSGVLTWDSDDGAGGGAPSDADYLVGTSNGSLSAEIVVGTSPGGELGGTWASPTIDADAVLWNEIGDAGADATIANGAHETDFTSTIDATDEAVITITNSDADAANDNALIDLRHNDGADANVFYARFIGDNDGTPATDYLFSQTAFTTGTNITPTFNSTVFSTQGYDVVGAVDLDIGSADVTDVAIVTDGTGDAEVVLPDQSISSTEILNSTIAAADIANGDHGDFTYTSNVADLDANSVGAAEIAADALLWNEIGDAGADATIANGAHETDFTSTIDAASEAVITITNSDADAANANTILVLAHNDGADAEVTYLTMTGDADGTPTTDFTFNQSTGFTSLLPVNPPAEAYDATGWNSDTGAPQKDAVRDKIEALAFSDIDGQVADAQIADAAVDGGSAGEIADNTIDANDIDETGNYSFSGIVEFDSDALQLDDTNASHQLIITPGSDLSADRVLTITTGDAARTLTLTGDATISGTNTGDVTLAGTPDYITISGQVITRAKLDLVDDLNTFSSANLATNLTDETGSGAAVLATSPALVTATVTGAPGLAISNGATSAGAIRILEDTDDGSNYTAITVPALAANVAYTLPPDDGSSGQVLHTDGSGVLTWDSDDGAGGGAPSDADYLVGTSNGSLSAEIVVGTSPGGELGGTWASPTIDADAVLWNEIGDAGADATIANGAHETDFTSTIDAAGEAVITVTNSDADAANANTVLMLAHNDGADAEVTYLTMTGDADGTPTTDFTFNQSTGFTSLLPVNVPAEAYDATGWNSDTGAPQKDGVRDEIENLPAKTTTFTNKTYDTQGTGNVFADIVEFDLNPIGWIRQSATGDSGYVGTNSRRWSLKFDDTTDEIFTISFVLPSYASGSTTFELEIQWYSAAATSGSAVFGLAESDVGTSENFDPSLSSITYQQTTTDGTAGDKNITTVTLSSPGWAGGESISLYLRRDADGTGGTDSLTGDAIVIGIKGKITVSK